jgi:hypothetical protein
METVMNKFELSKKAFLPDKRWKNTWFYF